MDHQYNRIYGRVGQRQVFYLISKMITNYDWDHDYGYDNIGDRDHGYNDYKTTSKEMLSSH